MSTVEVILGIGAIFALYGLSWTMEQVEKALHKLKIKAIAKIKSKFIQK